MILFTHSIAGAALAAAQKDPWFALLVGFLSHFVLDVVPHWEYGIEPLQKDPLSREAFPAYRKIVTDGLFGVAIPLALFVLWRGADFWLIFGGIVGGMLPDFLQGVHLVWRGNRPVAALYRFHQSIQRQTVELRSRPWIGITLTIVATAFFIWLGFRWA